MDEHLKDAVRLLHLADGREGPVDAQHATQLVIARALISIAKSLEALAESQQVADERADLQQMVALYKFE